MGLYCSQVWAAAATARRRGRDGADREGGMVVRRVRRERGLYMVSWRGWVLLILGINRLLWWVVGALG